MTTDPTNASKSNPPDDTPPFGEKKDGDPGQETDQPADAEREPLPVEFREFTASIRELFREIKKFIVFIRHRHNANAVLIFLTFLLAIAAFTQAVIYGLQLRPLRENAEAAKVAADTARKELELSQRPSVSLTDIKVISPLVFDTNGAHTTISYAFINTGHSAALDGVDLFDFMVPFAETPSAVSKRNELCKAAGAASGNIRKWGLRQSSQTWFPGQPEPMTFQISWNINDIKKAMVDTPKKLFPENTNPLPDRFMPTMVVCVAYQPSFTEAQYHTGYILELVHKKTFKGPLFMERGEIPAEDLQFVYHPFWGVYAD